MKQGSKQKTYSMVIAAMLLAVGIILPFITGNRQAIAKIISPLHIPVLICGLCCGWKWGLALGAILPLLRGLLFGIPVFPTSALPMAFELAAYGTFTGLLYSVFLNRSRSGKHLGGILFALITSLIIGRFVGGAATALVLSLGVIGSKTPFTCAAFFTSYFVSTALGALIHIFLIPVVVLALEKAKLSPMTV